MLTIERAQEVWDKRSTCWADSLPKLLAPDETKYVDQVWSTMPGNTSWMDAFFAVLNGKE